MEPCYNIELSNEFCNEIHCTFYDACHCNYGYCPIKLIKTVIGSFTEKEQTVINLHCGLSDGKNHSFEEIGRMFGVTGTRISQIYKNAVRSHKYIAYHGILKDILECGTQFTGYSLFYHDVFYNYERKIERKYTENNFEFIHCDGKNIPKSIIKRPDLIPDTIALHSQIIDKCNLKTDIWRISDLLLLQFNKHNIDTVAQLLSKPFHMIFFEILEFNYNLLIELLIHLKILFKDKIQIVGCPDEFSDPDISMLNSTKHKNTIKNYIKKYIIRYNQFFDKTYSDNLSLKSKIIYNSMILSETWYNFSIGNLHHINSKFFCFWQQSNMQGFYNIDDIINVLKDNKTPITNQLRSLLSKSIHDTFSEISLCEIMSSHGLSSLLRHFRYHYHFDTVNDILVYDKDDLLNEITSPYLSKKIHEIYNTSEKLLNNQ